MNYKSPIKIAEEISNNIIQQEEEYIVQEVRKVGVYVEKDELLKALSYDRNQYKKGYEDALANAIPIEWIKRYASKKSYNDGMDCYWSFWEEDVLKMIEDWENE